MYKIEKIFKINGEIPTQLSGYEFEGFLHKSGNGMKEGIYKFTVSYKVGKRRKLKKIKVDYYNLHTCDCCGPYYIGKVL